VIRNRNDAQAFDYLNLKAEYHQAQSKVSFCHAAAIVSHTAGEHMLCWLNLFNAMQAADTAIELQRKMASHPCVPSVIWTRPTI
jgi:hypothetical protein